MIARMVRLVEENRATSVIGHVEPTRKKVKASGRACSNSIASRKADGVNTHQVRTKTTYRTNSKWVRRYSVVRSCSCALKGMVLGLEGCLVGSTHGANETQYGNRVDLEITQSLNQTFGKALIFSTRCMIFSGVQSNDESNHQGQSLFQHVWRVEQSAFHETLRNSPRSRSSEESCSSLPY